MPFSLLDFTMNDNGARMTVSVAALRCEIRNIENAPDRLLRTTYTSSKIQLIAYGIRRRVETRPYGTDSLFLESGARY